MNRSLRDRTHRVTLAPTCRSARGSRASAARDSLLATNRWPDTRDIIWATQESVVHAGSTPVASLPETSLGLCTTCRGFLHWAVRAVIVWPTDGVRGGVPRAHRPQSQERVREWPGTPQICWGPTLRAGACASTGSHRRMVLLSLPPTGGLARDMDLIA
jgi:hypothetical protein